MEWPVMLTLLIVIPIILVLAVFAWYLNIGRISAAFWEVAKFRGLETLGRARRTAMVVIIPVGIYAFAVWFSLGNFGWQVALAVGVVLPIVLLVPLLVWATVVSGLYLVIRDTVRRRVTAPRRRAVG